MRYLRLRFASAYVQLVLHTLLVTCAEVCLKIGAVDSANVTERWGWTGLGGLLSPWIWTAIVLMILSFLTWLYVLKHLPLSVAYPLSNVVHVFVPLSCWLFLGEGISTRRWCGIALVIVGLAIVAKPAGKLEERL